MPAKMLRARVCVLMGYRWVLNNYDVQLLNADWLRDMLQLPDIKFGRSLESFKVMHRLLGTSLLGNHVREAT